jgi:hypothetical protein
VEKLLYPWFEENKAKVDDVDFVPNATKHFCNLNTNHLAKMVEQALKSLKGIHSQEIVVAVVSGVTINSQISNYFWCDKATLFTALNGKIIGESTFTITAGEEKTEVVNIKKSKA